MVSAVAWKNFKRANTVNLAAGNGPFDFVSFYEVLLKNPLTKHRPYGAGKKLASELVKLSAKEVAEVTAFFC